MVYSESLDLRELESLDEVVLILIVMDGVLGDYSTYHLKNINMLVLILIVMDGVLGAGYYKKKYPLARVLILIVMDGVLGEYPNLGVTVQKGTVLILIVMDGVLGADFKVGHYEGSPKVLILIVMDGVLGVLKGFNNKRSEERRVGKECSSLCRSRWSPYN